MKKLLLPFFLLLSACSSTLESSKLGARMPVARLYLMDGNTASLDDYSGRDLIVIFWASSCSHSYHALEDISKWKNSDRTASKYQVVSINVDKAEKEAKVKELLRKLGRTQIVHSYSGNDIYDEAYVAFDVSDLPTIFRIDRYGKVKAAGTSLAAVLG